MDSGLALYASLIRSSCGSSIICIRHLAPDSAVDNPLAIWSSVSPSSVATAATASALATWCIPTMRSPTAVLPSGVTKSKWAQPSRNSISFARISQLLVSPKKRLFPLCSEAIFGVKSSYVPRMATALGAKAEINSDLVRAIASIDPNSPLWAEPTLRTTPISGAAMAVSLAISPS